MSEEPLRRRRSRRLSDAERTLWNEVTRGIAPLRPARVSEEDRLPATPPAAPAATPKSPRSAPPPRAVEPAKPAAPPLAPLGRRMRQRIVRGSHAIGGRLDMHGLTQHEAHDALLGFLRSAQDRGHGLVLVITGKGAAGGEGGGRGVLKRQVPMWLRMPALREVVIGFEPAHVAHGGEGALYVRIRRVRPEP